MNTIFVSISSHFIILTVKTTCLTFIPPTYIVLPLLDLYLKTQKCTSRIFTTLNKYSPPSQDDLVSSIVGTGFPDFHQKLALAKSYLIGKALHQGRCCVIVHIQPQFSCVLLCLHDLYALWVKYVCLKQ